MNVYESSGEKIRETPILGDALLVQNVQCMLIRWMYLTFAIYYPQLSTQHPIFIKMQFRKLAFSRIFKVRFCGFSCLFRNFQFSDCLLIFHEINEMHRKDQVFIRPLGWSKVFYVSPFRQKRGSKFGHFRQFSQISREPNVLAKRAGCQKNRLKTFFLVKIVLQPGEPPDRFFCLCTRSFR